MKRWKQVGKKNQFNSTLDPYIGLFVILASEGCLYILDAVQECFKIVLWKLKGVRGACWKGSKMAKVKEKSKKLGRARKEKGSGREATGSRQGSWRGVAVSKLVAAFSFKLLCFLCVFRGLSWAQAAKPYALPQQRAVGSGHVALMPEECLHRNCSGAPHLVPRNLPRVQMPKTGPYTTRTLHDAGTCHQQSSHRDTFCWWLETCCDTAP